MRSDLINRTVLLAVLLMYNAVTETCEIPYFVRKEKKSEREFCKGWPKIKGDELREGGRKLEGRKIKGPKIKGTEN